MSLSPRAAFLVAATAVACLGQGVAVPFVDQLDAPGFPAAGWAITTSDPVGRIMLVAPSPLSPAGGLAAQFDVTTNNIFSTNALTLSVDLSGGGNYVLKYWARETADEANVEDGLFLSGSPAGTFVKVVDHQTLTGTWVEIVVDLNKNELNCTQLADPAVFAKRKGAWEMAVAANGGIHPNCGIADTRLLHRARLTAVPATRGGGLHPNREVWVRAPRTAERSGFTPKNKFRPDAFKAF